MTTTSTTAKMLSATAAAHGWTIETPEAGSTAADMAFVRGEGVDLEAITVWFDARGAVRLAAASGWTSSPTSGKRDAILVRLAQARPGVFVPEVTDRTDVDQLLARSKALHAEAHRLDAARLAHYADHYDQVVDRSARARTALLRSEARELRQLAQHLADGGTPAQLGLGEQAMTRETGGTIERPENVEQADDAERAGAYAAQSAETCDHGRLLWQSCGECGVPTWTPPAGPVTQLVGRVLRPAAPAAEPLVLDVVRIDGADVEQRDEYGLPIGRPVTIEQDAPELDSTHPVVGAVAEAIGPAELGPSSGTTSRLVHRAMLVTYLVATAEAARTMYDDGRPPVPSAPEQLREQGHAVTDADQAAELDRLRTQVDVLTVALAEAHQLASERAMQLAGVIGVEPADPGGTSWPVLLTDVRRLTQVHDQLRRADTANRAELATRLGVPELVHPVTWPELLDGVTMAARERDAWRAHQRRP